MLKINQESIDFLFNHSFLSKRVFKDVEILELDRELNDLLTFVQVNTTEKTHRDYINDVEVNGLVYDSIFFAIVEHHVNNALVLVN